MGAMMIPATPHASRRYFTHCRRFVSLPLDLLLLLAVAAWFEIVEYYSNELNNLGVTDIITKILSLKLNNESKANAHFLHQPYRSL